jgi:hypothetical protein
VSLKAGLSLSVAACAIATAAILIAFIAAVNAPSTRAEEPEITFQFALDGDVLREPPLVLQMCFKNPVNVKDLPPLDEGDFAFSLTRPDNIALGMRIVFQPDGYGVQIYPGTAEAGPPEGEWKWTYRVVDAEASFPAEDDDILEGEVKFSVNAATGIEILQPTPPACIAEGATNQPTTIPVPSEDGAETASPTGGLEDDDDGPDALTLALIGVGIAAAAILAGLAAFFILTRGGSGGGTRGGGAGGGTAGGPASDQP